MGRTPQREIVLISKKDDRARLLESVHMRLPLGLCCGKGRISTCGARQRVSKQTLENRDACCGQHTQQRLVRQAYQDAAKVKYDAFIAKWEVAAENNFELEPGLSRDGDHRPLGFGVEGLFAA
jgi:hypothetical protein